MKPKTTLFEIDPHPAHPPADLLKKWEDLWFDEEEHADVLLIRAFQAGADQELEECCEWLEQKGFAFVDEVRATRRPKSPSLKEQAIAVLDDAELDAAHYNILLRALEALPDD